jgi:hypothetical protein
LPEAHAPEEDLVDLVDERFDDPDLGGHLGASHNGGEGALGGGDGAIKVVQLLLQQEACYAGLQVLGDTLRGRVRAVSGSKRVVHVHLGVGRQLCRQHFVRITIIIHSVMILLDHPTTVIPTITIIISSRSIDIITVFYIIMDNCSYHYHDYSYCAGFNTIFLLLSC